MQANSACGELATYVSQFYLFLYPRRWRREWRANTEILKWLIQERIQDKATPDNSSVISYMNLADPEHFRPFHVYAWNSREYLLLNVSCSFSLFSVHLHHINVSNLIYTSSTRNFFVGLCVFPEMVKI